jgi:hypothetical protein
MSMRTFIGLLTRRATYLVRMDDLSSMSRHGLTERPQPFGIALWSLIPVLVVRRTFVLPSTRFNKSAQLAVDPYGDGADVYVLAAIYVSFPKD